MTRGLERALAILNGTVGDHLARTANGLATEMTLVPPGRPARQRATRGRRAVVLIHGLMGNETDWSFPDGEDYGSMLRRDFGFTPLYLRYNSGLPIHQNGAALAALLERTVARWPGRLDELMLVGHSMGGLVTRAALHLGARAQHRWPAKVKRAVYLGTPHRGAPMERVGRAVAGLLRAVNEPYTRLLGEVADLRSRGIKDLGDAVLRPEDAARRAGLSAGAKEHPVPLPPSVEHLLIAGAVVEQRWLRELVGDGVVPLASATDRRLTARVVRGVAHPKLAHSRAVYRQLARWYEARR